MRSFEKIALVTRKTRLQELVERFNTQAQAKFYIEHAGGDFSSYVAEHDTYEHSLESVRRSIAIGLKIQIIEREFLPTYLFTEADIIVTLGQDGLVANTAKYVGGQPIVLQSTRIRNASMAFCCPFLCLNSTGFWNSHWPEKQKSTR